MSIVPPARSMRVGADEASTPELYEVAGRAAPDPLRLHERRRADAGARVDSAPGHGGHWPGGAATKAVMERAVDEGRILVTPTHHSPCRRARFDERSANCSSRVSMAHRSPLN